MAGPQGAGSRGQFAQPAFAAMRKPAVSDIDPGEPARWLRHTPADGRRLGGRALRVYAALFSIVFKEANGKPPSLESFLSWTPMLEVV